jgi:hypothetical protein
MLCDLSKPKFGTRRAQVQILSPRLTFPNASQRRLRACLSHGLSLVFRPRPQAGGAMKKQKSSPPPVTAGFWMPGCRLQTPVNRSKPNHVRTAELFGAPAAGRSFGSFSRKGGRTKRLLVIEVSFVAPQSCCPRYRRHHEQPCAVLPRPDQKSTCARRPRALAWLDTATAGAGSG